jgi:Glycosyltransferase sugar-binding region containing DXD motif
MGHELVEWNDEMLDWVVWTDTCYGDARQQARHRANIARYQILSRYGGIWLDHDIVVLRSLPPEPWVASWGEGPLTGALAFDAGHPLPALMTEMQMKLKRHYTSLESGDRLIAKALGSMTKPVRQIPVMYDRQGRQVDAGAPLLHLWHGSSVY